MALVRMKTRFAIGVLICLITLYIPTFYSLFEEKKGKIVFEDVVPTFMTGQHLRIRTGQTSDTRLYQTNSNNFDLNATPPNASGNWTRNVTSQKYHDIAGNNSYFCIKARGRLGSALSHLATLHAIVRETKRKPVFCPKNGPISILKDTFRSIIGPYEDCFKKCPEVIHIKSRSRYDPTLIPRIKKVSLNISLRLPGSIFSWRYFDKYRDEIRRMFQVHERYMRAADHFISNIKHLPTDTTFICIHIRRTDRLGKKDLAKGYVFPEHTYFKNAIAYYRNNFVHPHFIVCSDDKKWCQENLRLPDLTISTSESYKEDFAILSRCNHSIITFGHFSWWGGYMAGGQVIYPKSAMKPGSHYAVKDMDRMPDTWIPM